MVIFTICDYESQMKIYTIFYPTAISKDQIWKHQLKKQTSDSPQKKIIQT